MEEFVIRIIIGALGAIAAVIVTRMWKDWQYKRGELTGTWEQIIYDKDHNITKKDIVNLKHNHFTKKIEGKIKREIPKDHCRKEWIFQGIIRGNMLFMIFWSSDVSVNPGSYGTIQLNEVHEGKLTGFYIRPNAEGIDGDLLYELNKTTMEWKRAT